MTTMELQKDISLAPYTNYKIGGPAKYFAAVGTLEELQGALKKARELNEPVFILAGGNNLLISDKGFNGVVIHPELCRLEASAQGVVTVGASVLVKDFLDFCIEKNLSGWEWAGGLPSTMGGAIWGNAGAFGGETKDKILEVSSIEVLSGKKVVRGKNECQFDYRSSIFKTTVRGEVIVEAQFQLAPGDPLKIRAMVEEKKQYRVVKQPLEYPNCGSVFKNVPIEKIPGQVLAQFKEKIKNDPFPVLPTAVLTAAAGLKGYTVGGAMLSEKHSNFIVNTGSATAADVRAVMAHIAQTVKEKFAVELEPEVIMVGEF